MAALGHPVAGSFIAQHRRERNRGLLLRQRFAILAGSAIPAAFSVTLRKRVAYVDDLYSVFGSFMKRA
jgi:hypothetical protein